MDSTALQTTLDLARDGDQDAFTQLMQFMAPPLIRYVGVIVRDGDIAEDVCQEAFVRAYRHLDQLRDPGKFRRWLWKIARCVAIDVQRIRSRSASNEVDPAQLMLDELDGFESDDGAADHRVLYDDILGDVRGIVATLPDSARELIELRYTEQLSYRRIGERLGLGVVQVKARLARARSKLRDSLDALDRELKELRDEMS